MADKLIYDHAVRAMFKGNARRLSPGALQRLKGLRIEPEGTLLPAYSADAWAECARIVAGDLHPGVEPVEAMRRVARGTVDAFAHELVGKAMFSLLRVIGIDRASRRLTQTFRSGSNFVETKSRRVSEDPITEEIWFNDVSGCPGFYWGLLEGGMDHLSANTRKVQLQGSDGTEATFLVSRLASPKP